MDTNTQHTHTHALLSLSPLLTAAARPRPPGRWAGSPSTGRPSAGTPGRSPRPRRWRPPWSGPGGRSGCAGRTGSRWGRRPRLRPRRRPRRTPKSWRLGERKERVERVAAFFCAPFLHAAHCPCPSAAHTHTHSLQARRAPPWLGKPRGVRSVRGRQACLHTHAGGRVRRRPIGAPPFSGLPLSPVALKLGALSTTG